MSLIGCRLIVSISYTYCRIRSKAKQNIRIRFGVAVKMRRYELKVSQEELAERAGLHRTYVGDIERGSRNVSLENIEKLAVALELSLSDLFTRCGVDRVTGKS
jgi:DNA-binding XRE family transcriptional regulator